MKHPHAEVIKAWADGKTIQGRNPSGDWEDFEYDGANYLMFSKNAEYRIKPEEVVRYTIVYGSGAVGVNWMEAEHAAMQYYCNYADTMQGFLKRTTIDGKVVKMEFIPK